MDSPKSLCKNSSHALFHSFFIDSPDTFYARVHSCIRMEKYMALETWCSSSLMAVPMKSMKKVAFALQRLMQGHVAWDTGGFFFIYIFLTDV